MAIKADINRALIQSSDQVFLQDAGSTKLDWVQKNWARGQKLSVVVTVASGIITLAGALILIYDAIKTRKQNKKERFSVLVGEYVRKVEANPIQAGAVKADVLFDRIVALSRNSKDLKKAKELISEAFKKGSSPKLKVNKKILLEIEKTFEARIAKAAARQLVSNPHHGMSTRTYFFFPSNAKEVRKILTEQVNKGFFSSVELAQKAVASEFLVRELNEDMRIKGLKHNGVEVDATEVVIEQGGRSLIYESLIKEPKSFNDLLELYVDHLPKTIKKQGQPIIQESISDLLFDEIVREAQSTTNDSKCKELLDLAKKRIDTEIAKKRIPASVRYRIKSEFQDNVARAAARRITSDKEMLPSWLFYSINKKKLADQYIELVRRGFFPSVPIAQKMVASAYARDAVRRHMQREGFNCSGLTVRVNDLRIDVPKESLLEVC